MTRRMQALVIVRVRCLCRFRTRTAKTYIDTIKGQFNIAIELPLHILL